MKNCEICGKITYTERHHINSRCFQGSNRPYNISLLCPNCHAAVHRGSIVIEGKFMTSSGYQLVYHSKSEMAVISEEAPAVYLM